MAYRIMLVKTKRDNYRSLYKFMTVEDEDGNVSPLEIETKEELDAKIEEMLNGDFAKSDFLVVNVIDYTIDAKDYSDEVVDDGEDTVDDSGEDDESSEDGT